MDIPGPTVSYWPRRKTLVLMLLGSMLLAAAFTWLIDAALFGGTISGTSIDLRGHHGVRLLAVIPLICILVYYSALFAYRLARWQPSLTLKPEGFTLCPFYGSTRFIGWDEISEVSIFDFRSGSAGRRYGLGIGLRDPDRYLKRLGFYGQQDATSNARKIGYHLYIGTALVSEPLENVQKAMQRFLEKSRHPET